MLRLKRYFANILLFVVSSAAFLCSAELLFRASGVKRLPGTYEGKRIQYTSWGRIECVHPDMMRPYYEQSGPQNGCIEYRFNNLGSRNNVDFTEHPADQTVRVLGLGDSFLFGFGVHVQDTFLFKLSNALKRQRGTPPVEVLNFGRPGFNTEQEFELLNQLLPRVSPDVVLLAVHLNDFLDFPTSQILERVRTRFDFPLRKQSRLLDYLLYRYELFRSSDENIASIVASYTPRSQAYIFDYLGRFKSVLDPLGIRFIVVVFPIFYRLDDYPFLRIHDDLDAYLAQHGIPSVDLFPLFKGQQDSELWITRNDQHPNERANDQIATRMSEFLHDHPELLSKASPSTHPGG